LFVSLEKGRGFFLHPGKDLAVSPFALLKINLSFNEDSPTFIGASPFSGLGVSVRTSGIAAGGHYPLPLPL